ncbi:MAG: hypothetical protein DRN68_01865 [Thaumarchaeota archaeon]|nr:MAG: hypothetical protein DRN68_01865 [Nitrososphaerota archaeon]
MIALVLESSEYEARRRAEYIRDRQSHRIRKRLEEYSLKINLGYIHLIAEEGSVLADGRRLLWINHNTPEVEDFPKMVLEAESVKDLISILKRVDGFFSGVKIMDNSIILFRDHIGLIPLNMKVVDGRLSAASERFSMGEDAKPIKPGMISIFDESGLKSVKWHEPTPVLVSDPVDYLAGQIKNSIKNYVPERCSIAFSGGLDSSIIAYLALQLGKKVEPIVVGVEGCVDFEQALEAADILGITLKKVLVHEKEILETVQSLIERLPRRSLMDLSLASVFHLVSRNSTTKTIVAGQGADELFGGYWKYVEMYKKIGEKVNELIIRDLENLYITNLERDELAVASAKSTLITPYLTRRIYELSKSIELGMKLRKVNEEIVRKWILRKAAETLGVPERLRLRPKKAAQYGSGVLKVVKKLFEKGLLTERSSHG